MSSDGEKCLGSSKDQLIILWFTTCYLFLLLRLFAAKKYWFQRITIHVPRIAWCCTYVWDLHQFDDLCSGGSYKRSTKFLQALTNIFSDMHSSVFTFVLSHMLCLLVILLLKCCTWIVRLMKGTCYCSHTGDYFVHSSNFSLIYVQICSYLSWF